MDKTRYIDIVEFINKSSNIYTDWEGFADTEGILERADKAAKICSDYIHREEHFKTLKTLLAHWLHDCRDQADYEPSDETLMGVASAIDMVISCRYFLKEDAT